MTIKIKNAIIQYPELYVAKSFEGGKSFFSGKILLNKESNSGEIEEIKNELRKLCLDNKMLFKPDNFKCFKDGSLSGVEELDNYYILTSKASEKFPPKVVGRDGVDTKQEVPGGSIVNLRVDFWIYTFSGMKGIACNLKGVQITNSINENFKTSSGALSDQDSFEALETQECDF